MKVNEDAEGVRALQDRAAALEEALRPFVHSARYSSGVDSHGARWCSPRVSVEEMDRARSLLGGGPSDSDQHVDLYADNPLAGTSAFVKRLALDAPEMVTPTGHPTQLAVGWATYAHVSEPHTDAECPNR